MGKTLQYIGYVSVLVISSLCVCQGFKFQATFLDPAYDEYGNEISRDRVLEIMDMKSTDLGYGNGYTYHGVDPSSRPVLPPYARRPSYRRPPIVVRSAGQRPSTTISYRRNPYSARSFKKKRNFTPLRRRLYKRQARSSVNDRINAEILDHLSRIPLDIDPSPAPTESFSHFPAYFPSGLRAPSGMRKRGCGYQQPIRCNAHSRYRTIDGLCNNLDNPKWGAIMQPLRRMHDFNYYYDGWNIPRLTSTVNHGRLLPSARMVSRTIHEPDRRGQEIPELTNIIQVWGQFIDHDITGTPAHLDERGEDLKCCRNVYLTQDRQIHPHAFNGGPCNPIYIPPLDRHFTYSCMNFARSQAVQRERDCNPHARREVRQQMNMLTAYMDGSQIYGSSLKDNDAIRLYRYGMLRVTPEDLLPEDVNSTCVKDFPGDYCFRAGEMRVNEHPALTSIHTVFHRLHNQMAIALTRLNPRWDDEMIFQEVRKIMSGVMQFITYHDWLPIILGPDVMRNYGLTVRGLRDNPSSHSRYWYYDQHTNPGIFNAFATAAFRFGHTLIPGSFTVGPEKIRLHHMFNRPHFVLRDRGASVRKFCSGLLHDNVQHFDRFITTELSDHLFEDRNNISLDLASLNIQRSRDHGLPTYNDYREACNLPRIRSFEQWYDEEPERAGIFRRVYDHVDDIDIFPGGISERPLAGAVVGHTFACIIAKQMRNIKYGDRYWFESEERPLAFTPEQIREIRSFSLSRILCTMAPIDETLINPFFKDGAFLPEPVALTSGEVAVRNRYVPCSLLKTIDMRAWYDPKGR